MSGGAVALPAAAGRTSRTRTQIGSLAGRSVLRTLRQPAMIVPSIAFPLFLLAVNSAGLHTATQIPGFPTDSYLTFVLAVALHPGCPVRDDELGPVAGRRHRERLLQPPRPDPDAGIGLDRRPARRARRDRPAAGGLLPHRRARRGGRLRSRHPRCARPLLPLDPDLDRVRRDRNVDGDPDRLRRSGPGHVPAALRAALLQLDHAAAGPDRAPIGSRPWRRSIRSAI